MSSSHIKDIVVQFTEALCNEKDLEKAAKYLADDFINHRDSPIRGRQANISAFSHFVLAPHPDYAFSIHKIVAEGDSVWVLGEVLPEPDSKSHFVVDIWRLADGKIFEHWEVSSASGLE